MQPRSPARNAARRLPRDQRVAAILLTARAVLRERGSEQFLTAEVAERCGTSEATIYKYFPTKRDLLIQIAESWFDEFLAEDYPARASGSIRDRLYHAVWWSLSSIRREPALTRFVLMELRADPNYRSMRIYQQNREVVGRVMTVIEDGRDKGVLRADLSRKLVRDMIFGAIEHQTWAYLRGEGDFSVDESAEQITEVILRGISASAPSSGSLSDAVAMLEQVTASLKKQSAGES
ncbi:TetR/AcrR family transcriptional regulator [Kumtagia ephedrae]|uniref:TetR family transcriptional regulator n=1 Tax=Kumtagia ephedrae TaxID=2116701 RepID=A0A2P7S5T9_9HYPH|nr:TetR/AcrR family transcriptional regulator [Mesorhizobium ephedrae]PSJ57791.1 TetR family transcriptional regulator [Mesorhizobium ephedrae]